MVALNFAFWFLVGFVGTEVASYYMHKYLFHGPLWFMHKTHHTRGKGLEANDIFSLFFTCVAIVMMAVSDSFVSTTFALASGITLFGMFYFFVHDAYIHRRIFGFNSNLGWLNWLRSAHRRHHQSVDKPGQEPFGLLWVRDDVTREKSQATKSNSNFASFRDEA